MSDSNVPPPDEPGLLPSWLTDSNARKEVENWDNEEVLKGQRDKNMLRWLKVYGWIVPSMMVVFSVLYLSTLVVYAIHFLTTWGWLDFDQLSKIQSIIFSGSER